MKLFAFGDSWTAGQGCNTKIEESFIDINERKIYRNSMSWPKFLSDLLKVDFQNLSKTGSSNKEIFDTIVESVKSKEIKENDLVVIMWSSSLRDEVPFFPKEENHVWGINYLKEEHRTKWFISNKLTKNSIYNDFLISFKEFYLNELYTNDYYNIINQNYILFTQKLFEYYNINYMFCDAFDKMIDNIKIENDKTYHINKSVYWGFGEKTFKDFLIDTNDKYVWENYKIDIKKTPGMHPSSFGYQLIANEINSFIEQHNIIKYIQTPKKNKIL